MMKWLGQRAKQSNFAYLELNRSKWWTKKECLYRSINVITGDWAMKNFNKRKPQVINVIELDHHDINGGKR